MNHPIQQPAIRTYVQADGYVSHYRLWGAAEGSDVIVLLHGGMSHSGWQAPLADAILSMSNISFIAPDRRGSGLNIQARGHMLSQEQVIDDVISFLSFLKQSFTRVHLAGWCFGGQIASVVASKVESQNLISTLLLITPGFFWNDRYSDVLRLSIQSVFEVVNEFNLDPDPLHAFIPLPLQVTDFTVKPEWRQFIVDDQLRLTKVTKNTVLVSYEIQEKAKEAISEIDDLPVLVVLGHQDKLIDNHKVQSLLVEKISSPEIKIEFLDANHGVQFDQPDQLAKLVTGFVSQAGRVDKSRSVVLKMEPASV